MRQTYLVNGWVITAPFDLGHPAPADALPDVVIDVQPEALAPEVGRRPLTGRVIAHHGDDARNYELVLHDPDRATFRFHHTVDFSIDLSARRSGTGPVLVEARMFEHADRNLVPLIGAGTLLSALLLLEGHVVLHASAVQFERRTVAFVGSSGSGKSTLATMACLAGGQLVTDDVLRVEVDAGRAVCHRGAAHLRLRQGAVPLLDGSDQPENWTADGRRIFLPATPQHPIVDLDAIVAPLLCNPGSTITRTRLSTKRAVFALLGELRVTNWVDPGSSALHLTTLLDVVERIPVYTLEIPWGVGAGGAAIEQVLAAVWDDDDPAIDRLRSTTP